MGPETVLYSKDGPVARVVLNRPRQINAYNMQMRDELFQTLEAIRDDPEVRATIISGAGDRGFCAGADLTEFGTSPSQVAARQVRWERDVWGLFRHISKPFIAALHGHVTGSGVEIAALCDVRIASDDAVFSMPEVALGMIPAAGGTQTLPRVMDRGSAFEMMLSGRSLSAHEALRAGLVSAVVPTARLQAEAERVARLVASLDPEAVAAAKRAMMDGVDLTAQESLDLEERLAARLMSDDRGAQASG